MEYIFPFLSSVSLNRLNSLLICFDHFVQYFELQKMDVMCPDLLWVGNRCYRLPVLHSDTSEYHRNLERNEWIISESHSNENNFEDEEDEACNTDELIETLSNNRYKLKFSVSQSFWSKIIGCKGVTKKRIENDTNTTVIVPRPMDHGDVIIKGVSKRNVILAKKSIEAVIASSRQKLVFTHFISIPMNCEEIKKNFIMFKENVLKLFRKDRGIDDSIFQNPAKLHLTIGTLVLTDQNERNLAEKLLTDVFEKSVKPLIANQNDVLIEMQGIEYMNDDPAEVDILYAKVRSVGNDNLIKEIADHIVKHFSYHKLLKSDEKEEIKLHVTLMNTLFREEEPDELNLEDESVNKSKWIKKARRTFNAINILQKFHDFYFGQDKLRTIQLSVRFSAAKDGYYKSSYVINL